MNAIIGQPFTRVDGPAKVRGEARYAAEFKPDGMAYAAVVTATIPAGRITAIDTAEALKSPGVICIVSHENAPKLPYKDLPKRPQVDPKAGFQLKVFQGPEVLFSGQPVAVVVAETPEQAQVASALVKLEYELFQPLTAFEPERAREPSEPTVQDGRPGETERGGTESAYAAAAHKVDVTYVQPREHHNPMEIHATVAAWDGDKKLTLWDKTQWVDNVAKEIAAVFGLEASDIHVISPFVGGAFGSALRTWPHVTVAAIAAKAAGRPVRLELTRRQHYYSNGFRPRTEQRVAYAAGEEGLLSAMIHEAVGQTSTYEEYAETTLDPPRQTYSCPNNKTTYRLVEMHTNTPCSMRAPGVATGVLAQEMGMDELAYELGIDPLELRLKNYAGRDEYKDHPWSSKELKACYERAAERFGWSGRTPEPRSMRDGRHLVGWGMATGVYPSHRSPAKAKARLTANGEAVLQSAASDMGPGTYTSMTQVAAETLGLTLDQVRFELGDTDLPMAPVHGGSITMASVGNAVRDAAEQLTKKLADLVRSAPEGPFAGASADEIEARDGGLARKDGGEVVPYPELLRRHNLSWLDADGSSEPGEEAEKFTSSAFGAVFAEVRVDPDLGTIRVPRLVGAYDVGRVINPRIAHSQAIGGMVMGVGMALLEEAEWDPRFGRVMNANLAEYLVPVCADIVELHAEFVPSDDTTFNPLGVKGLAEIAVCGVAPAIANAVFHATGQRVRTLPITPDKLLV